jgi:hypothetical protein
METLQVEIQAFFQRGAIPSWVAPSLLDYVGVLVGKREDKVGIGSSDQPFVFDDFNYTRLCAFIIDCMDDCQTHPTVWMNVRKCIVAVNKSNRQMIVTIPVVHTDRRYAVSAPLRPDVERTLQKLQESAELLGLSFETRRQFIPSYIA